MVGRLRYGNEGSIRTVIQRFRRGPVFTGGSTSELYNEWEIAADESTGRCNNVMEN